jgi:hypothetical protein
MKPLSTLDPVGWTACPNCLSSWLGEPWNVDTLGNVLEYKKRQLLWVQVSNPQPATADKVLCPDCGSVFDRSSGKLVMTASKIDTVEDKPDVNS